MSIYLQRLQEKYPKLILNKKEAAEELRVSTETIDRLRRKGTLKSKKIGGSVFFKVEEIAAFLDT